MMNTIKIKNPLSAEGIQATTAIGRQLREARERMRLAIDGKPRTAAEVEAANLLEEYRHGGIFTNETDGRELVGISPSFPNDFRHA